MDSATKDALLEQAKAIHQITKALSNMRGETEQLLEILEVMMEEISDMRDEIKELKKQSPTEGRFSTGNIMMSNGDVLQLVGVSFQQDK